jgi:hypothetical protein
MWRYINFVPKKTTFFLPFQRPLRMLLLLHILLPGLRSFSTTPAFCFYGGTLLSVPDLHPNTQVVSVYYFSTLQIISSTFRWGEAVGPRSLERGGVSCFLQD